MNKNTVLIYHSGGCYYNRMLLMVQLALRKEVKDVDVIDQALPCISGAFEVQLQTPKKKVLLHSKLNTGESVLEENLGRLVERIKREIK